MTYYLQQTLAYSPLVTGVAFLPLSAGLVLASNLSFLIHRFLHGHGDQIPVMRFPLPDLNHRFRPDSLVRAAG
jgi:hypothetical protein